MLSLALLGLSLSLALLGLSFSWGPGEIVRADYLITSKSYGQPTSFDVLRGGTALRVSAEVIFSRHTIFRSRIAINGVEELRENYAEHFLPLVHRALVAED